MCSSIHSQSRFTYNEHISNKIMHIKQQHLQEWVAKDNIDYKIISWESTKEE